MPVKWPRVHVDRAVETLCHSAAEPVRVRSKHMDRGPTVDTESLGERVQPDAIVVESGSEAKTVPDDNSLGRVEPKVEHFLTYRCELRGVFLTRHDESRKDPLSRIGRLQELGI